MIMKVWTISVLLLFLVCLTVPFVTADKKSLEEAEPIGLKEKPFRTPAAIEYQRDILAPIKEPLGLKVDPVDITIDGKWVASIPEDSPLFNIPTTNECLSLWPYGTIQEVKCELGEL
jgi:hypothetical protein